MNALRDRLLSSTLTLALVAALGWTAVPSAQAAPSTMAGMLAASLAASPGHQRRYARQQVRVARPVRNARWTTAPRGAVRVSHRSFDPRWQWRSAPRYRVMYTRYRDDLWFLDPTTGWAYSVDRYGIVYTADPYRGWVYSLGPLTRWTVDLLYFFDLFRFDRGYWIVRDFDYFDEIWLGRPRYGYYGYETAYSTLWGWERYWYSPTFVNYTINITNVFITEVRQQHVYIDQHPQYRQEMLQSIDRTAVTAAPPPSISPQAIATSSFWEASDLAAAGVPVQELQLGPNTVQASDGSQAFAPAGTVVDTSEMPLEFVAQPIAADSIESFGGFSELPRELKPDLDASIADAPSMAIPDDVTSIENPGAYGEPAAPSMSEPQSAGIDAEDMGYYPKGMPPSEPNSTEEGPATAAPGFESEFNTGDSSWMDSGGIEPRYEEPRYEEPIYAEPQYEAPAYEAPEQSAEEPNDAAPQQSESEEESPWQ